MVYNAHLSYDKPQSLAEYIGQPKAKRLVEVMVGAALKTNQPLPNTLISGPFGQGKTALAVIMADMYRKDIQLLDAATFNKEVPPDGTYIVDEIHNIDPSVADSLNIRLDQNRFHIIGCTTNPGAVPAAFRSRFRQIHLNRYEIKDIDQIIQQALNKKNIIASNQAVLNIAKRSRYNPRTGLSYLAYALDLMVVKNEHVINLKLLKEAFDNLGVDEYGLTLRDYDYLKALHTDHPVGLQGISAKIGVDAETIEQEIEPYLLHLGLIDRTPRGRIRIEVK